MPVIWKGKNATVHEMVLYSEVTVGVSTNCLCCVVAAFLLWLLECDGDFRCVSLGDLLLDAEHDVCALLVVSDGDPPREAVRVLFEHEEPRVAGDGLGERVLDAHVRVGPQTHSKRTGRARVPERALAHEAAVDERGDGPREQGLCAAVRALDDEERGRRCARCNAVVRRGRHVPQHKRRKRVLLARARNWSVAAHR